MSLGCIIPEEYKLIGPEANRRPVFISAEPSFGRQVVSAVQNDFTIRIRAEDPNLDDDLVVRFFNEGFSGPDSRRLASGGEILLVNGLGSGLDETIHSGELGGFNLCGLWAPAMGETRFYIFAVLADRKLSNAPGRQHELEDAVGFKQEALWEFECR
jgi:hypothetical protein